MNINCILDWESYQSKRNSRNFDEETDFKMDQQLILAFCNPSIAENVYMDLYEKIITVNGKHYSTKEINFKDNWELLMHAVDCIEVMGYFSTIEKFNNVDIHRMWFNECKTMAEFASGARGGTKKVTIYEAVLDFCKVYVRKYRDKIIENGGKL